MLENISKGVETVTKLSNMQDSAEKLYSKTYKTMATENPFRNSSAGLFSIDCITAHY